MTLSLEDTIKKEEKRWKESLDGAYNELLNLENMPNLSFARTTISWLIYEAFKEAPSLLEEQNGRKTWERYLSGLRYLSSGIEHSFLLKFVFPMLNLGEVKDNILDWNSEALRLTNELYYVGNRFEEYLTHMAKAMEINKEKYDMCALYSSLKTWDNEEKFDEFSNRLNSFLDKPFEIYIEGPIQLFLTISKDNFFFILRSFLVGKLSELIRPKKTEEKDLEMLNEKISQLFQDSKTIQYFLVMLKNTMKGAFESWTKEQKERRDMVPTPSSRISFLKNFENGYIK